MHSKSWLNIVALVFQLSGGFSVALVEGISIQTRTPRLSNVSQSQLQNFLATPANWPLIVASSLSVQGGYDQVNRPAKVGERVQETFGIPPILTASVEWTCEVNQPGRLQFGSKQGLQGIATDCRMNFSIEDEFVVMTMEYEPTSPLAILAAPLLTIDNDLALKVLLPLAFRL